PPGGKEPADIAGGGDPPRDGGVRIGGRRGRGEGIPAAPADRPHQRFAQVGPPKRPWTYVPTTRPSALTAPSATRSPVVERTRSANGGQPSRSVIPRCSS